MNPLISIGAIRLKKTNNEGVLQSALTGSMLQARLSRCQVVALMLLKNASTCGSHPRIGDSKGGRGCRLLSSAVHIRGKGDSASRRVSHPWLVPLTHVLGVALGRAANDDVAHPEGRGNKNWQPQWQGCHQSYPSNAAKARTCRQETLSSTAHFFYRRKKWSPNVQPDAPLLAPLATRKIFGSSERDGFAVSLCVARFLKLSLHFWRRREFSHTFDWNIAVDFAFQSARFVSRCKW